MAESFQQQLAFEIEQLDLLAATYGAFLDQLERQAPDDEPLAVRLGDYLGFRHFYRHSYGFSLDWAKLAPLILQLRPTWQEARRQLLRFAEAADIDNARRADTPRG